MDQLFTSFRASKLGIVMKKGSGIQIDHFFDQVRQGTIQTVDELWQAVHGVNPQFRSEEFMHELHEAIAQGSLSLVGRPVRTFSDYVKSWRYGFRARATALSIVVAVILVETLSGGFPLILIRWVAGTFLILIAPGFSLVWALFPSRDQPAGLSRLALTVAMSLFLVPITGLFLNYTPLGIHADSIGLIMAGMSLVFLYVGMRREFVIVRRGAARF